MASVRDSVVPLRLATYAFGEMLAQQAAPPPADVMVMVDALPWHTVDISSPPKRRLPVDASHVRVTNTTGLTRMPDDFLQQQVGVRVVELAPSAIDCVTELGDDFLYKCTSLTMFDASGWRNVTVIGDCFLFKCTALAMFDASGWSAVTTIGDWFLCGCTALTMLDASSWSQLTTTGDCFLSGCTALTTVDVSGWSAVTTIGDGFLIDCTVLSTVDASQWTSVTSVGTCFLDELALPFLTST